MARHVRKGDQVMITAGDHRGKTGTVVRVIPQDDRVVVQGINLRTKHVRPTRANPQGAVVSREAPIHISNVSPLVEGRATRVRFVTKPDGRKIRVAARNGQELGEVRSAQAKSGS